MNVPLMLDARCSSSLRYFFFISAVKLERSAIDARLLTGIYTTVLFNAHYETHIIKITHIYNFKAI